jgi:hypothetical protein
VSERLERAVPPPALATHRAQSVTMRTVDAELHADDELWPAPGGKDQPSPARGRITGEIRVELERSAVEVLVGEA